jgi:hypothetical protein
MAQATAPILDSTGPDISMKVSILALVAPELIRINSFR